MALAGGLLARSHGAGDSGASGNFCARSARFVGAIDDSIFLPRWGTRIPGVDNARVVVGLCDRLGALPCIDSTTVEYLNPGCRNRRSVWILAPSNQYQSRSASALAIGSSQPRCGVPAAQL